jgi:predicted transposase YdaD
LFIKAGYLINFEEVPEFLKDDVIFKEFFMEAEITNFSKEEYWAYVASMKDEWEANRTKAALKQKEAEGERKGEQKGEQKGILLMLKAVRMKKAGESVEKIVQQTGLDSHLVLQL